MTVMDRGRFLLTGGYVRVESVAQAVDAARYDGNALCLAGGQSTATIR